MSIRIRLIVMVAGGIFALLVVGGVGVLSLQRVMSQMEIVTTEAVPQVTAINDLGAAYRDLKVLLLSHLMEQDADLKKAFGEKIAEQEKAAAAALQRYQSQKATLAESGAGNALGTAYASYIASYHETLELSSAGKNDLAQAALFGKVLPSSKTVEDVLNKSLASNLQREDAAVKNVNTVYRGAMGSFAVVIAGAFTGLLVFGLLLHRAVARPLATLQHAVGTIQRELDFRPRVTVSGRDEVGTTVIAFNSLLDSIQNSFKDIAQGVQRVSSQADDMASTAGKLSGSAHNASNASAEMAATVQQVTVSINHIADRSGEAAQLSQRSEQTAEEGKTVIDDAVKEINAIALLVRDAAAQIDQLARQSQTIHAVVGVIRDVADQTNLLALNAAIEAARAGEQGRGFAVVADEVRKLAERTAGSTQEIAKLVTGIETGADNAAKAMRETVVQVEDGVSKARLAGEAILQIRGSVTEVVGMITDISSAISEQSTASTSMAQQVERIALLSEEASNVAIHAAESAEHLQQLSQHMQDVVTRYKV